MKKLCIFLLLASLLLTALVVGVGAADTGTITPKIFVEDAYAIPGKTVMVHISIADNPGVVGAGISLTYSDKLTLLTATKGVAFATFNMTPPGQYVSGCTFLWDNTSVSELEIWDGTILTLMFDVSNDAVAGELLEVGIQVTYLAKDVPGSAEPERITPEVKNGAVTVVETLPGDYNGDKRVDITDIVLIRRTLAGGYLIPGRLYTEAADVNDDGTVDITDIILIRRYLAGGYNVTLRPSRGTGCEHADLKEITAKDPTCTEPGNIRYWSCPDCSRCYTDATCTKETAAGETVLAATGHKLSDRWEIDSDGHARLLATADEGCGHNANDLLSAALSDTSLSDEEQRALLDATYGAGFADVLPAVHNYENGSCTVCACQTFHTVDFLRYDGTVLATYCVEKGTPIALPAGPERSGWVFNGWGSLGADTEILTVTEDTTYQATYLQQFTVTFRDAFADTPVSKTEIVTQGSCATPPAISEDHAGYTFLGWTCEATGEIAINIQNIPVNSDTVYIATYAKNPVVTFMLELETKYIVSVPVGATLTDEKIALPTITWDDTAYRFDGWLVDNGKTSILCQNGELLSLTITENLTVTPKYSKKLTLTFTSEGKEEQISNYAGDTLTEIPTAGAKTGFSFVGWYHETLGTVLSSEELTTATFLGDTHLTALYEAKDYTLNFYDWSSTNAQMGASGALLYSETVKYDEIAAYLANNADKLSALLPAYFVDWTAIDESIGDNTHAKSAVYQFSDWVSAESHEDCTVSYRPVQDALSLITDPILAIKPVEPKSGNVEVVLLNAQNLLAVELSFKYWADGFDSSQQPYIVELSCPSIGENNASTADDAGVLKYIWVGNPSNPVSPGGDLTLMEISLNVKNMTKLIVNIPEAQIIVKGENSNEKITPNCIPLSITK